MKSKTHKTIIRGSIIARLIDRTIVGDRVDTRLVELWLPPMDHPEGEKLLAVDAVYLPDLIAALRAIQDFNRD